jgi:RNA polymerase sigma-70 factor (TIGR02943 family)
MAPTKAAAFVLNKEAYLPDFAEQLAALRPLLVRIARQRLRNDAWVEDAVSETLLAALERPSAFEGRAKLQSWLIGILKHKLVDQARSHTRERAFEFDDDAHERFEPELPCRLELAAWSDPQLALQRSQFISQINLCLEGLPPRHSLAFVLSDWLEFETSDVCQELGITANHLYVMLFRVRRCLRLSMNLRAFEAQSYVQ